MNADSGGVKLPSPCGTVTRMGIPDAESDFNQWLHAMKMVARLPGGMPPDFRRKLWLALSDRYLQNKGVNWKQEEEKCFSETWGADDQELGVQIVKDLHRTGSSLCSGPAGTINQAKLKRILLGYARWNPEVGYCQGFNMLGALILQVMDKNESDAIKVMIFLIEGLIPSGYFHGALGGLQADMAVFRELLGTKLPKLARHLQKLQGPQDERALEPPLTNVFTMQWFLTLFCNCLPINCVLRVWDLILIEGSDVLLRTALAIWSLLEEKILLAKTADDFYCKMGEISGELLTGTLIDSNGLVQRIVDLGPIKDLDRMRERHRQSIPSLKQKKGLKVFYSDDDLESDEESKMAVATVWGGLRGQNRRSSQPNVRAQNNVDTKQTIALDINILKKQYNKLRERQKQAHVILSSAVNARQPPQPATTSATATTSSQGNQINNLLAGKSAIISNKRRLGPPTGAVPLARNIKQSKPIKVPGSNVGANKQASLNWKDIKQDENTKQRDVQGKKRHDSSSYSEDSDSSTSTSLCDDDPPGLSCSSVEGSPLKKDLFQVPVENRVENLDKRIADLTEDFEGSKERKMLEFESILENTSTNPEPPEPDTDDNKDKYKDIEYERIKDDELLDVEVELAGSFSPLEEFSPINDAPKFLSISPISPFRTPSPILDYSSFIKSLQSKSSSSITITTTTILTTTHDTSSTALINSDNSEASQFIVTDEGVTNELFERINSADPRLKSPTTVLELPIGVTSLPDASIIPACADMAAIPADCSPLINKNTIFNTDDAKTDATVAVEKPIAARRESADLTAFMEENSKMLSRITTRKVDAETPLEKPEIKPTSVKADSETPSEKSEIKSNLVKTDAETPFEKPEIKPTSVKADSKTPPEKPEIKPSLVKAENESNSSPKTPKLTKRVTFSEEDNTVELIQARTPTEDDDVHVMRLNPKTVEEEIEEEEEKPENRGNYYFGTMDEIDQEMAQRKLKPQCTEISEEEKVKMESELIHEEQEIVEKLGKVNEITGTCIREIVEDVKIEIHGNDKNDPLLSRKLQAKRIAEEAASSKNLRMEEKRLDEELKRKFLEERMLEDDYKRRLADETRREDDLRRKLADEKRLEDDMKRKMADVKRLEDDFKRKSLEKKIQDEFPSRKTLSEPKTYEEPKKIEEKVPNYRRDRSPDPMSSSYEFKREVNDRELPSTDMTSSFPRASRKTMDYHMSSFDEMKLEIRKEMHNLKSDLYDTRKHDNDIEYDKKFKRPETLRKTDDLCLQQLSTDTLRSLLKETKEELYGLANNAATPVKICVDNESRSPYQRSPAKSRDPSPSIDDKFVLKDNSDLLRNSAKNREFADQFGQMMKNGSVKVSLSRDASPARKNLSRDSSPVRKNLSRETSPARRNLSREASPARKGTSPERFLDESLMYRNSAKNRLFANDLDIDSQKTSPAKLSPRAELHAILTKPSIKETMDFSYFDDIREPSLTENRSIKLFSNNEELKTPTLRDPTNIKDKISSISKTINSINSLCRGETRYECTYRTLERYCDKKDVESVRKEMNQDRLDKVLDDIMIKSAAPTPIVRISEADDFQKRREFSHSPRSASRSRSSSPRRPLPQYAENDFEARVSLAQSNIRYAAKNNFEKLDRYMFKKESEFALAGLPYDAPKRSTESLYTRSTSPLEKTSKTYPNDLDIRHSTVTSTFYDRYLYQKNGKLDKSPSSPTVNRAYLDSLKPGGYRVTRSAETSPNRGNFRTDNLQVILSKKESKYGALLKRADNAIKSCEDIPRQLRAAEANDKKFRSSHQDLLSSSYN